MWVCFQSLSLFPLLLEPTSSFFFFQNLIFILPCVKPQTLSLVWSLMFFFPCSSEAWRAVRLCCPVLPVISNYLALKTVWSQVIQLHAQLFQQTSDCSKAALCFYITVWQRVSPLTKPKSSQVLGDKCSFKPKLSYAKLVDLLSANECLGIEHLELERMLKSVGACHQTWPPEFKSWHLHSGRREPTTSSHLLTHTHVFLWCIDAPYPK